MLNVLLGFPLFFLFFAPLHAIQDTQSWDLPDNFKQLLYWEIQANSFHKDNRKAPYFFPVEYVLIPKKWVQKDINHELFGADLEESLIEKGINGSRGEEGERIRWILNPEDRKYRKELLSFLRKQGMNPKIHQDRFDGYLTSSRSMILRDKVNNAIFSVKVSTDWTGGGFKKGKHLPLVDAHESRRGTDFVYSLWKKNKERFQKSVFLWESASFNIKAIDRSMIIRNYDELRKEGNQNLYYLPGFSALFPTEGARIAKENGAMGTNLGIADYWLKHYALPLARAFAEFVAYCGMSYESAHSQQFLIEMRKETDGRFVPTGRIVFRDFNDSFPYGGYRLHPRELLNNWRMMNKRDHLNVRFGILKAINKKQEVDGWITPELRETWGKKFFDVFEKRYSKISGVPAQEFNLHVLTQGTTGSYLVKTYFNESPSWKRYLNTLSFCYKNPEMHQSYLDCPRYLENPREYVKGLSLPKGKKKSGKSQMFDKLKVNIIDRF